MGNDSSFFGNIFDEPEDDPLLGDSPSESSSERKGSPQASDQRPSWVQTSSRDGEPSRSDASRTERGGGTGGEDAPSEKTVSVTLGGGEGLDQINESIKGGWRLFHVALDQRGDASRREDPPTRLVMTLRREEASSLFDFG